MAAHAAERGRTREIKDVAGGTILAAAVGGCTVVRLDVSDGGGAGNLLFPKIDSDLALPLLIRRNVMNTHPYLRAYMAGITVPSMVLVIILSGFVLARYAFEIPIPIERALVFPMALVPNIFGMWNIFYLWLRARRHLPIGLHGAILPFILAPAGFGLAACLGFLTATSHGLVWFQQIVIPYGELATGFCVALIAYYLVWKYLVGFFNQILGIA
jgi:hypothetical protein